MEQKYQGKTSSEPAGAASRPVEKSTLTPLRWIIFYAPRINYDEYDMRGFYEEVREYFARSPGSSIWVRFEDLPCETRNKLGQKIDTGDACWPKPEED